MTLARLTAIACMTACMSPVMQFGEGKTAKQAQRDTMTDFAPARLATDKKWSGEVTTRKIRVWADNEYRAQNRRWQDSFETPLGLANLVLTPTFGLTLVAEYRAWERHVPGARLEDHLAALAAHDTGEDVLAVVGLTSSLPLVSATFDELGLAMLGGRHLMLRGYADLEERKLYANAFPDLTADERELALVHLRHHKTAVVLLHELGHLFGFAHETDADTIMHATYSRRATAFSEPARVAMLRTLAQRLHRKSSEPAAVVASAQPAVATPAVATPAPQREPIVIRMTKAGALIVDGQRIKADSLDDLFKRAVSEDAATKIIIMKDRSVGADVIASVIDRAKAAGLTKFEFAWSGQ